MPQLIRGEGVSGGITGGKWGHMSDTHDRKLAIPDYRNMLDAVPD
jgi:hypothetical protein